MTGSEINLSITNNGSGIVVRINSVPAAMTVIPPLSVMQLLAFVPDLPNGGQVPLLQLASENGWNIFSKMPNSDYCDDKSTVRWDGYAKGRWIGNGVSAIWSAQVGVDYFIPYNKFYFTAAEVGNTHTPAYDGSFGSGTLSDGGTRDFTIIFNGWADSVLGGTLRVTKSVTVASAPYTLNDCLNVAPPPPVQIAQKKSTGKPQK